MHYDAYKGDLLLFDTLSDQIVLEQVRVVDVAADVAALGLFAAKALLALASAGGEQLDWHFPAEKLLECPASRRLICTAPLVKRSGCLAADLLSRSEYRRFFRVTFHHHVSLSSLDWICLGDAHDLIELPLSEVLPCVILHQQVVRLLCDHLEVGSFLIGLFLELTMCVLLLAKFHRLNGAGFVRLDSQNRE